MEMENNLRCREYLLGHALNFFFKAAVRNIHFDDSGTPCGQKR